MKARKYDYTMAICDLCGRRDCVSRHPKLRRILRKLVRAAVFATSSLNDDNFREDDSPTQRSFDNANRAELILEAGRIARKLVP